MKKCIKCGSHAFNLYAEEIDQGGFCDVHYWQGRAHRAEALAQPPLPVQEPDRDKDSHDCWYKRQHFDPIYNTPPLPVQEQPKPLTDEQIKTLWIQYRAALPRYLCFARAIEAAHNIGGATK